MSLRWALRLSTSKRVSPFELGLGLVTGRTSKAWNTRAIRARALIAGAVGGTPPSAAADPPMPPSDAREGRLAMKTAAPARAQAVEAAKDLVDALGRRRMDRLAELLGEQVWVLWPNGNLLRHGRAALAEELASRSGDRLPLRITDPKSYSYAELRTALARGVAEGLDAALDLSESLLVTLHVSGGRGPAGRILLVMHPEPAGWRARSLPLGGPDDAHVLSAKLRELDRPEAAALQPLVRAIILGHGGLVRAHFQHVMPKLWLRDQLVEAEQVARLTDDGPPRLGSTEIVFGRVREVELKRLDQLAPKAGRAKVEGRAFEDFGLELEALSPRLLSVELGTVDPASGRATPGPPAHGLVVLAEDDAGRRRPRVAGLYL